jgi:hypothetical protein
MHRSRLLVAALAAFTFTSTASVADAVDLSVGVSIKVPAPPVVLATPPLVIVPGSTVQHVPSASFNLFVYHGRYYSFHNGSWFIATGPNAPWRVVAFDAVPAPVRAVPVKHYKIPPGHAKKMSAQEGGWCPPGQAKKGRC